MITEPKITIINRNNDCALTYTLIDLDGNARDLFFYIVGWINLDDVCFESIKKNMY